MQEFIYLLRPTRIGMVTEGATSEEKQAVQAHFQYLTKLHEESVIVLAGRTSNNDENTFGVVIFRAEDEAAATKLVDNDPAVAQNVMSAELFPYRIAIH